MPDQPEEREYEPLFPELPEDLAALSDEDLQSLLDEHQVAVDLIDSEDSDFTGDLTADQILAEYEQGVEQIKAIRGEQQARVEANEAYEARKAELRAEARPDEVSAESEEDEPSDNGDDEPAPEEEQVVAAAEEILAEEAAKEEEPVVAAAAEEKPQPKAEMRQPPARVYRKPPAASEDRQLAETPRAVLVATGSASDTRPDTELDRIGLAKALMSAASRLGKPTKHANGAEERHIVASADFPFPEERVLRYNDIDGNSRKVAAIGSPFLDQGGRDALVATGGLCAPLTPFYDIPDLAVTDRPVRDALPSFRADRGGVSVPSVSIIGDITTAISEVEEWEDALGGTFATKSCQDLTCPTWTDVAVGMIAHCREYGNLNSRAWPEGIAHENNLTMAALARVAESRLLNLIKAGSVQNTAGATTLSAWSHLVYALKREAASIRGVLRLGLDFRLRALMPAYLRDLLQVDQVQGAFDRFMGPEEAVAHLRAYGIDPAFYLDTPSGANSQIMSAEVNLSPLDAFPSVAQIALFPEGTWLHLDGGTLELGVVRDSSLNSTNDYQVFGEIFESVARIGPTQAARWLNITLCPVGSIPAAGTAVSC